MVAEWVLYTINFALVALIGFIAVRTKSKAELTSSVKELALQLFLIAEKQNWIGEKKMDWASEKLAELVPDGILRKVIGKEEIRSWLQKLYDDTKAFLSNTK